MVSNSFSTPRSNFFRSVPIRPVLLQNRGVSVVVSEMSPSSTIHISPTSAGSPPKRAPLSGRVLRQEKPPLTPKIYAAVRRLTEKKQEAALPVYKPSVEPVRIIKTPEEIALAAQRLSEKKKPTLLPDMQAPTIVKTKEEIAASVHRLATQRPNPPEKEPLPPAVVKTKEEIADLLRRLAPPILLPQMPQKRHFTEDDIVPSFVSRLSVAKEPPHPETSRTSRARTVSPRFFDRLANPTQNSAPIEPCKPIGERLAEATKHLSQRSRKTEAEPLLEGRKRAKSPIYVPLKASELLFSAGK